MSIDEEREEEWENHLRRFFPCCPLCGSDGIEIDIAFGRRYDYVVCPDCRAKWEVDWKGEGFLIESVKLVEGKAPVQDEFNPDTWRKMALRKQKTRPSKEKASEKEIIREKEIIVKIRCPYCHKLYDETLDKCPNCGGSR